MPRVARIVVPKAPHHVIQRGNNCQNVFFVDDDRRAYLEFLAAQCERYGVSQLAYCLMTNHVHLVVVPKSEAALARAIGRTHWLYTQYVNRLHRRSGHLWQNRFYSCALDVYHFWQACAYVERNPVRSRMVRLAWRYRWSSAAAHVGEAGPPEWLNINTWRSWGPPRNWRRELQRPEDEESVKRLIGATLRGRPLGSDGFLSRLEHKLGRRIRANPIGRPKAKKSRRIRRRGNGKKGQKKANK